MKAVRFHAQGDLRVEDLDEPTVGPGEVKLKVEWCGLCGTDLHEYTAGPIFVPTQDAPHAVTGESAPVVLGHEFSGQVVECGEEVTRVSRDDNVAVEPLVRDNTCNACQRGLYNVCDNVGFHGLSGGGGGLSEHTVVPEFMVHRLPDGMSTETGALIEPIAVGWHAVQQANFRAGQTALVVGAGPIGLVTVLALKAAGARWVAVSEMADARKKKAEQFGADLVLDPQEDDVAVKIDEITGGGVDAAFECTGKKPTLETAVHSTRRHGVVCNVAIWEQPTELQMNDLVFTEVVLTSSLAYAHDFPAVLAAVQDGRIDASQLITARIDLEDVVQGGFEELVNNKDQHVKILVRP
ncbi:2,3-butanediol dehydrogenase [Parasphingorhabdus pacifica]